jgi:AcrR family transcriptional regulator
MENAAIPQNERRRQAVRDRILDAADRLFYGQGIRAIGVDTVAAEADVSKRTLYNHFPSKDDLIVAYLSRRIPVPRESDRPPLEQILRSFDGLERTIADADFRGCPFVNAVAEVADAHHPARAVAVTFKEGRRIWLYERLQRLGVPDAYELATQLHLLVDGAIAAGLVRGDPKVGRSARAAAVTLLRAAGLAVDDSAEIPKPGGTK